MKYRSKPVVKEAEQFKFPYEADLAAQKAYCDGLGVKIEYDEAHAKRQGIAMVRFSIETLEGPHVVSDNDYIITGLKGERYPCKPDIFEMSYEPFKEPELPRTFPYMKPRRWQQKESKKFFKVVPWMQPIDNESRLDFKALFRDICPEFGEDVLADMEIYSGLVMHCGYQVYNDGGTWLCFQHSLKDFFDDLGEWNEAEHGIPDPAFPVTEEAIKKKGEGSGND